MAKKKAAKKIVRKLNKPLLRVNPDRPFPPPPPKKKTTKKKVDPFKNMGTGKGKSKPKSVPKSQEFDLSKIAWPTKKGIFKRFKDWLGNAWFVFFNSYGG